MANLSVVIPAHNCEAYLPTAIASVQAQLRIDTQIIVVDDGSTDRTRSIVEAMPQVVYLQQSRAGAAAARNTGVRAAAGTFLAFLDADDYWAANKIARQLQCMSECGADMIFGHAEEFCSEDVPSTVELPPPAAARPARCAGTMLIARDTFQRAGTFQTGWRVGEFIDWYLRATDLGLTAGMLPEVVLYRRLHAENSGRRAGIAREDYPRIIKRAMDRRRARNAAPETRQP